MTSLYFSPSHAQRRDRFAGAAVAWDDVLRGFLVRPASTAPAEVARSFKLDVREEGNDYVVVADLPGLNKDGIKIEIDGAQVSVSAEYTEYQAKAAPKDGESVAARVVYSERSTGPVARSIELPAEIDQAGSSARYENGVLTLTLPKKVAETRKLLAIH